MRTIALSVLLVAALAAQVARPEWRHIGNAAIDESLASVATGPVNRVWYSENGARLYARTASGSIFFTVVFE